MKTKGKLCLLVSVSTLWFGCVTNPKPETVSIHDLIRKGQIEKAEECFSLKHDINAIDQDGNSALHLAAEMNLPDLVRFLTIKKADTELKNYNNDTPLHVAIKNNSKEAVRALLDANADPFSLNTNRITAMEEAFLRNNQYYDYFITNRTNEICKADRGETLCHYFVRTKNEIALNQYIKKALPINTKNSEGFTPLGLCYSSMSDSKSVELAALLIYNGAEEVDSPYNYFQKACQSRNLNYRFSDGQTPLHLAAINNHYAILKYLLENNAMSNMQDSSGATPLHEAIRYGNVNIAKLLLLNGADVNAKDNLGKTPILLLMDDSKRKELYTLLIDYKARLDVKDTYGDSIFHIATMTNCSRDLMDMFLRYNADINARNKDGETPLQTAIQNGNIDHIIFYTQANADINTKDMRGNTPLTLSLVSSNEVFQNLITRNNITSQDANGNIPLNTAIINNAPLDKIEYLIKMTDNINQCNSEGNTPLYLSVMKNRKNVGEQLLKRDADIFATNNLNESPLSLALKQGESVMDWLINDKTIRMTDGSGNTALHYASEWALINSIHVLVEKGANTEARNANGETPLFNACKTDNASLVKELVQIGSQINVRDNLGATPLHQAVRWDNGNTCKQLINLGIDINSQNVSGKTALAEAAISGKFNITKDLLDAGANPNIGDTSGRTILMDAVKNKNVNLIKLLISYDASTQVQELNGRNAYHEAALTNSEDIIALIRNAGGNPLSRDKMGETPFSLSLKDGGEYMRAVLGSDVTISDSDGNTPIHIITRNKCTPELLNTLLSAGYPMDTKNSLGYTPLAIAVKTNNDEYAEILLSKGANPFTFIDTKGNNSIAMAMRNNNEIILSDMVRYSSKMSDIQGNTILHYAARNSNAEMVKKLLEMGLEKSVTNISGETPYVTALRWNKNEIANLLEKS